MLPPVSASNATRTYKLSEGLPVTPEKMYKSQVRVRVRVKVRVKISMPTLTLTLTLSLSPSFSL
jgi:hypothetical protein